MKLIEILKEKISSDNPLSRNQIRLALVKANINIIKATTVARQVPEKALSSPKELAIFLKNAGFHVEQTMDLVKYLWKINENLEQEIFEEISIQQLNYAEDIIDAMWNKLGIDVEFSKHFFDRLNDSRNGKDITTKELIDLFKKEYEKHGSEIKKLNDNDEAILKDILSKLNLPFIIHDKGKYKQLLTKTIMRNNNFKSLDKKFEV